MSNKRGLYDEKIVILQIQRHETPHLCVFPIHNKRESQACLFLIIKRK